MRTFFAVSALILLGAATQPVPIADPALELNVQVYPTIYSHYQLLARPTPDTYTCTAALTDPDAKRGFAQVQLIAKPGTPVDTTKKSGDYEMYFKVDISKTENIARTKVVVKHSGRIVARQSSVVRLLQPSDKGYRPAQ